MKNIILTGFMGTGKSYVGRRLATMIGYKFKDIDEIIEKTENMKINEIFELFGEEHFRKIETVVLEMELKDEGIVVSTGGGVVLSEKNRKLIRKAGIVVNLTATPEQILERLAEDHERPLLKKEKNIQKIRKMMLERNSYYEESDIQIDTTGKNVDDVISEIMRRIEYEV